ncbi:MAG: hypothetical protein A3G34_02460 [Candidatus Lindowbacteria bacterium RIFCSPLOWO2_12_FULL_62_27]|nr:MAG: hypothetical protein A3G34_02460 [Candidatus Lindowbacteria bacterium RIFCSPLOWO2_12_FULL_62_27]
MNLKIAAGLIAITAIVLTATIAGAEDPTFIGAYGTFSNANLAIDGDPATFAETSKTYRNEYFLIVRFNAPSVLRNVKVKFEGKKPKDYLVEMSMDAVAWRSYEIGEKTLYIRVRVPGATDNDVYRIAEIESKSDVAGLEPFEMVRMNITNVETTTATLEFTFNKPARLSMSYGLDANPSNHKNFTEYTSYMTNYTLRQTDLIEGADYYFRIKAITAEGEVFVPSETEALPHFRTLGTPPLSLLSVGVGYVSPLSLSIVVRTNIPSNCVFYFGEQVYFTDVRSKPTFDTTHVFEFKDLVPNHLYSYMAFLTDFRGLNVNIQKRFITTTAVNIARNKRVIAGTFTQQRESNFQGGGLVKGDTTMQKLTDGKNDYFNGMAHSENLIKYDQWAVIDLGKVYTLESHATVWRTLAYPYTYQLLASEDNRTWKQVFTMNPQRMGAGEKIRSGGGDPLLVAGGPLEQAKARYVKLFIPKGTEFFKRHKTWYNVDLAEIMIYPGGDYAEIKRIVEEEWQP